jgi:hypothetical protein
MHGEKRDVFRVCWKTLKESDRFDDLGLCGRLKLKCVLKEQGGVALIGFFWLRIRTSGVLL